MLECFKFLVCYYLIGYFFSFAYILFKFHDDTANYTNFENIFVYRKSQRMAMFIIATLWPVIVLTIPVLVSSFGMLIFCFYLVYLIINFIRFVFNLPENALKFIVKVIDKVIDKAIGSI